MWGAVSMFVIEREPCLLVKLQFRKRSA